MYIRTSSATRGSSAGRKSDKILVDLKNFKILYRLLLGFQGI